MKERNRSKDRVNALPLEITSPFTSVTFSPTHILPIVADRELDFIALQTLWVSPMCALFFPTPKILEERTAGINQCTNIKIFGRFIC
jgi:hypothetical protein